MTKSMGKKLEWHVSAADSLRQISKATIGGLGRKFAGLGRWFSGVCGKMKPKVLGLFLACAGFIFFAPGLRAAPSANGPVGTGDIETTTGNQLTIFTDTFFWDAYYLRRNKFNASAYSNGDEYRIVPI
ncbi:MAG: hypothetical protein LBS87_00790, partial [Puniceicoccales bacterium]|nr:hypothetical protein [Puniceicoccales bacterium]